MNDSQDSHEKLSQIIKSLTECGENLTLIEIINRLGHRSLALITIFFVAPFLQPVPLIGFSTPFGILIAMCGVGIGFSVQIWLPRSIANFVVKAEWLLKIGGAAHYILSRVETIAKPRCTWFVRATRILSGIILIFLGTFLALPLPLPFSNFIPAVLIFLIALGLAEEDFLFILLGYLLFITASFATLTVFDIIITWTKEHIK